MTRIVGRVLVKPALSEMKSNGHLAHGLAALPTISPEKGSFIGG